MVFWLTAVIILILDQGSKYLIKSNFNLFDSVPLIPNIFHLTYIENPGAAFGMLAHKRLFFILITFVILAIIFYLYMKMGKSNKVLDISLGLVVGGAIGNLLDRLLTGTVTDFFDFRVFPIFNIADSAIVIGMIIVAYQFIIKGEEF
ncbi:signal peptidase II [Desulfonispora thiosulfatigenes DSM 11270]|uniref:Lipoprotein signal peptidase n=1 Tax=Desulfonispora thiosulfatigenes DSM 11270 TaxID=656914 RepID=A0A1W1VJN8_DESTI|nr:signal peptidase II [Desulfonispora thiosulfatigenes]SMB93271.1 signal peptidase II [Desulfonispora thiosulfatigenes DSM 11270]